MEKNPLKHNVAGSGGDQGCDTEVDPTVLKPLKITVAPTGARRQKSDHPKLPLSVAEIADDARRCAAAGADEIHLHVRDSDGGHSLSVNLYQLAIRTIERIAPGLDIQITTEAAGCFSVQQQYDLLRQLRPKAASIAVREVMQNPDLAASIYSLCADAGVAVQHILYDHGDLAHLRQMLADRVLPDDMRDVLLVLGKYSPARAARPDEVEPFVRQLAGDFPNWTVCAFGSQELAVAATAIRLGGHVRIGFENNIHTPDGLLAVDNANNIARTVAQARSIGRPLRQDQRPT